MKPSGPREEFGCIMNKDLLISKYENGVESCLFI
jgi:hypothetical protein